MRARRKVVVVLTSAEADMLAYLAGDLLGDIDEFRETHGGAKTRLAIRAAEKLDDARRAAKARARVATQP